MAKVKAHPNEWDVAHNNAKKAIKAAKALEASLGGWSPQVGMAEDTISPAQREVLTKLRSELKLWHHLAERIADGCAHRSPVS